MIHLKDKVRQHDNGLLLVGLIVVCLTGCKNLPIQATITETTPPSSENKELPAEKPAPIEEIVIDGSESVPNEQTVKPPLQLAKSKFLVTSWEVHDG